MTLEKTVYVVVLAWNHVEDTIECLDSMLKSTYTPLHLVLVDNASTDGTPGIIRERFPYVDVVQSNKNLGVTGGYNLGMDFATARGADYVLIANNDISVDPGMVSALVNALENDPKVGIGMPKIYHYYGNRQRLWMIGGRWRKIPPSTKTIGRDTPDSEAYSRPMDLEYVPSCCLLLRGEAVSKVGAFDTGYFFYYDDWDYSARMRDAGYIIRFVPEARMWHKVSISTQNSEKPAKWWGYFGRSTVRFYSQHARPWQLTAFLLWFTLRETLKGKFRRVQPFWQGVREERAQSRILPA